MTDPARVLIFEPYPMGRIGGNLRTLSYILEKLDRTKVHQLQQHRLELAGRVSSEPVCVASRAN